MLIGAKSLIGSYGALVVFGTIDMTLVLAQSRSGNRRGRG